MEERTIELLEHSVIKFVELLKREVTRIERNRDAYAKDFAHTGKRLQEEISKYNVGINELNRTLKDVQDALND